LQAGPSAAGESEISLARQTVAQTKEGFDRLAKLVEFLLSPASDGITGKLISAPWDDWENFGEERERLQGSELLTLRRVTLPESDA
jgi:3-oxoacyl-[acyl-carrier protein] reductase